jgi:hypothetical protein
MSHNVMPNQKYFLANVQLAISASCADDAIDGLNEFLRPVLVDGFIADYRLTDGENMASADSGDSPDEGELFCHEQTYSVCIIGPDHNEQWCKVRTGLPIASMNEDELCTHIAPLFDVSPHEWYEGEYRVFIGAIDGMNTLSIDAG